MFIFNKIGEEKEKFILIPIKEVYTIGRLSTDLVLADDLSISRTHVRLLLPKAGTGGALSVIDLDSKYGTYINSGIQAKKKMAAKVQTPLKVGDKIRLGALKNIWELSELKLAISHSSINRDELSELEELINPLGGSITSTWSKQCSHLTMENVTVTVKLLHALLDNKPIVSIAYWRAVNKMARRVHVNEDWPQPEDYMPRVPADMPSIKWNPARTKLFAGKTVVFCSRKHYETYAPVVEKAGGACKDRSTGVRMQFLTKSDVIVVQYVPSTQSQSSQTISNIYELLEQAGRRLIPDYEIGLSILHCSTDKFCNPCHKMSDNSVPTTESMDSSILIPNTVATERGIINDCTEFVLPESDMSDSQTTESSEPKRSVRTVNRKRNSVTYLDSSDEDVQSPVAKKSKTAIVEKKKNNSSDKEQLTLLKKPNTRSPKNQATEDAAKENVELKPRRSTRSNFKEPEKPAAAESRSLLRNKEKLSFVIDDDSDEEQDLFQFKTKVNASQPVAEKPTTPDTSKPANESINQSTTAAAQKPTIRVKNFLSKPQETVAASQEVAPVASQSSQPQKRSRLQQLDDSDSDDDQPLFNFACAKKPKQVESSNDDDDGLFSFKPPTQPTINNDVEKDLQETSSTDPFTVVTKKTSKYVSHLPREKSVFVKKTGWISCNRIPDDIKPKAELSEVPVDDVQATEQKIKAEDEVDSETAAHLNWLAKMKDTIQVRMCNLNITRALDDSKTSMDTTDRKYSGRKNFKKFVKTQNPCPQQRILRLKRMQLAEGMVKVL